MRHAIDFSFARPPSGLIQAAGYEGVLVYNGPAIPTSDEIADYQVHGLGVTFIYETAEDWAFGGRQAGINAVAHTDRVTPSPKDRPVYYAVDRRNTADHAAQIRECFTAICELTDRVAVGVYGSDETMDAVAGCHPKLSYRWGVETWIAGSGGANAQVQNVGLWFAKYNPQLVQLSNSKAPDVPGFDYDSNVILADDWGQWPAPTAPISPEDDDMAAAYIAKKSDPNVGIWVTDSQTKRHVLGHEWAFVQYVNPAAKVLELDDEWWDSIPEVG